MGGKRSLAQFGYVAPAVSVSCILLATLVDPEFTWRSRSLSSIGEAPFPAGIGGLGDVAFFLFNGGLLLAGVLGLPFVVALWRDADDRLERAGVGCLVLTLLGNVGIAAAYLDGPLDPLHFPFALATFLGITLTLWVYGSGRVRRTGGDAGLVAIWLANAHVIGWLGWIVAEATVFTGDGAVWTYFAVPEILGTIALSGFIVAQARRLLTGPERGAIEA